jgi:hypothetical protein
MFSSGTSVGFQRTARRCIPEGRTLHNHRCENLRQLNGRLVTIPVLFLSWSSCFSYPGKNGGKIEWDSNAFIYLQK